MPSPFAVPSALGPAQLRAWRASLSLTLLRLALAPVILLCAWLVAPSWPLVVGLIAALLSDILDGRVLARAGVDAP